MSAHRVLTAFFLALAVFGSLGTGGQSQRLPPPPLPDPLPIPKPAPIEKLGPTSYRVGQLRVDTAKREVAAAGEINDVSTLEFVANTKNGSKAYESLLTVDTNAISFNAALLLIGLDPARSRVPKVHFDPEPPKGDPLEIWVEFGSPLRRVRVETLLFDRRTKTTMPEGPWVYTGSVFIDTSFGRRYLAEIDGVLIGFVHSPAPVIENPGAGAVDAYGSLVLNPNLGLTAGSPMTLIIKALPRAQ